MAASQRERLESLRDHFAERLSEAADRDATAIGRLIKDIDTDLARMPNPSEVSNADEIAQRREARRSSSSSTPRAKRQS